MLSLERVLQLGAGGGGAATAHALLELGVRSLLVCDRDADRAATLARRLQNGSSAPRAIAIDDPLSVIGTVDGVVNATPMGMAANPQAPIDTSKLSSRQWVADIVYFPIETELLRAARGRGCATLDGSRMAVYQAAAAFEIFTGRKADPARMLKSFMEFSGGRRPPLRVEYRPENLRPRAANQIQSAPSSISIASNGAARMLARPSSTPRSAHCRRSSSESTSSVRRNGSTSQA